MGNPGRQFLEEDIDAQGQRSCRKATLAFVWETLTVPVPLLKVRAVSLWQMVMYTGWSSSCSLC